MAPATPFLVLDLAAFDRNAAAMAARIITAGGKAWRPHVKAIRVPALAKRLIAAGACGVTVATVDEAEAMAEAGIADILIANIVVGAHKAARVAQLNRRERVTVCVDHPDHITPLDDAAREADVRVAILVEVDIGLGRAGIGETSSVALLAHRIAACANLTFAGLMAWEGHATRIVDRPAREAAIRDAIAKLGDAKRACERSGVPVTIVSCGGTATYEVTSTLDDVTELQAGGGVLGDLRSRTVFRLPLEPALGVAATVLSRPAANRAVCDAGWKALGTFPVQPQLRTQHAVRSIAWSAEHATVEFERAIDDLAVGDRVTFDVGYSDSTVFLHDRLVILGGEGIGDTWPIPRRKAA